MKHSNPVPMITVNPAKGFDSVKKDNGQMFKRTKKGTPVVRTLRIGRMISAGELVEVVIKTKQEEVTDGK